MKATIESKKIVEYSKRGSNEKSIDTITVKYPASFLKNINKRGRVKKEHENLNKVEFNYFLTIRGINKSSFKKILDRLRKADKSLQYVCLLYTSPSPRD